MKLSFIKVTWQFPIPHSLLVLSIISTFSYFHVQLINLNYYNRNLWYMIIYDPTFLLTSCIWWITCGLLHPIYMNWNADEGEFFRCGIGKNRRPAKSFYQIWQSWNKRRSLVKYCVIYIIHYFFFVVLMYLFLVLYLLIFCSLLICLLNWFAPRSIN